MAVHSARTLTLSLLALLLATHPGLAAPERTAPPTLFAVVVYDTETTHAAFLGTAFAACGPDTALTARHVVDAALRDPARFGILLVTGHDFYSATVLRASPLPYDMRSLTGHRPVPPGTDLAVLRVTAPHTAFAGWATLSASGPHIVAQAHRGALPAFARARFGPADPGSRVGVPVNDLLEPSHPGLVISGTVTSLLQARDSARLIAVRMAQRVPWGASGAPLITAHGVVAGMWTWGSADNTPSGMAQQVSDAVCETDIAHRPARAR
jgi:hypothetical protein